MDRSVFLQNLALDINGNDAMADSMANSRSDISVVENKALLVIKKTGS